MKLDRAVVQKLTVRLRADNYVRILPRHHAAMPLGMGFGRTRFSSPRDRFKLLYLAQDVKTAVAETIIRDRFEGSAERILMQEELDRYSIVNVTNPKPLLLVDVRNEGASVLGISTDAVRAKAQGKGRRFSQDLYDQTDLDGLVYMSRITNKQCLAVYDRAVSGALQTGGPAIELSRLAQLASALRDLQVTLLTGQ